MSFFSRKCKSKTYEPEKKTALLIGINYIGTSNELNGCINDVKNMKDYLEEQGYEKIVVMTDESTAVRYQPTKSNILREFKIMINKPKEENWKFFLHYSGHGSWKTDIQNEEVDGRDECLCTLDGLYITDDELFFILKRIKYTHKLFSVIDACHSGTIMDLKSSVKCTTNTDTSQSFEIVFNKLKTLVLNNNNIRMISGCQDEQTSADAWIDSEAQGALTYSFLEALNNSSEFIVKDLLGDIHVILTTGGYTQKPVVSSSDEISLTETITL